MKKIVLIILSAILVLISNCTREVEHKPLKSDYKIDSVWFWQLSPGEQDSSGNDLKSDTVLGQLFYIFSNNEYIFTIPTEFKYGLTVSRSKFNFLTKEGKIAITDSFNNFHRNNWESKLFPGTLK